MTLKLHLQLLLYSSVTWLAFYLVGLPDYYQHWAFWAKLGALPAVTLAYFPIARYTLDQFWGDGRHFRNSLWLALYLTLPLFIYDHLLLVWYKGLGIGFVIPYFYLSFFYFSFWLQIPYIGWRMERQNKEAGL